MVVRSKLRYFFPPNGFYGQFTRFKHQLAKLPGFGRVYLFCVFHIYNMISVYYIMGNIVQSKIVLTCCTTLVRK